jgi:hypothetical protein
MKKLFLALIALFTFGYGTANAQSFGVYGALSLPMGAFSDDSGDKAGAAKLGFGAGVQIGLPIVESPSGVFDIMGDVAFLHNPIDEKTSGIKDGAYTNIPVMGGIRYSAILNPDFSIYGMGLAGVDIAMFSDIKALNGTTYSSSTETSFAFGIGAGVIFSEKFNVGVRYLSLGTPKYEFSANGTTVGYIETSISMLLITAGISF